MLLGCVTGTVWATRKDEGLEGLKLLIVEALDPKLEPKGGFVVAVDACEAGVGEVVLVAQGSSARQTKATHNRPVDAVVMAIVENLELLDPRVLESAYQGRREKILESLAAQESGAGL